MAAPDERTLEPADFSTLLVEEREDRVVVLLNRPEVRNAIDQQMVDELHVVCAALEQNPKVLIIAGVDGVFASGADIAQLRERRRDDALQGINSTIFVRIAKLPMPVIAALDGYCLGGGAELAYAADFRIGTPSVRIGNPETGLGILAAAGASWRLKELVGEPVAKEILLAGSVLRAEEALAVNLITEIHEAPELMDARPRPGRPDRPQDPLAVRITKSVFHAPAEAHPLIDQLAQGILFESQAKFDRMQAFLDKKSDKKAKTSDTKSEQTQTGRRIDHEQLRMPREPSPAVGVLGGGRMGAGIAHAFLINGANVVVVERDEDVRRSRPRAGGIRRGQEHRARRHRTATWTRWSSRLAVTVDYDDFKDRHLVVEAVPEDWDLKVTSLRGIEERLADDAYLASNTSSLSVNGLAGELQRPAELPGPALLQPGARVHPDRSGARRADVPALAQAARGWVEALGKTAVVVNDAPGFASSRLGVAIALEAMRMVEEGVASAEDIDAAMVLGYKHPTGPLRTTDIVGLDVRLGIAEYLHSTLGERFAPPQILRDKVARGELGRKTGKGFFDWAS